MSSRLVLINALQLAGYRVVVAAAPDPSLPTLIATGAEFMPIPFTRGGIHLGSDIAAFRALRKLYRRGFDLALHFNTKPIVYGGLAIQGKRTTVVSTVTGLGYGIYGGGISSSVVKTLFRLSLRASSAVIFQNPDDQALFITERLSDERKTHLIPSSGIDTEHYRPPDTERSSDAPIVLFAARLVKQKGLHVFAEAAQIVRRRFPSARFVVAGESDPTHPDAVDPRLIEDWAERDVIEFIGHSSSMRQLFWDSTIYVLPSTFGEGTPRSALEAASTALPVVTSDVPGCREVVINDKTGFLVTPGDAHELAGRIVELLDAPELRQRMGAAARSLMLRKFDYRTILSQTLELYRTLGVAVNYAPEGPV